MVQDRTFGVMESWKIGLLENWNAGTFVSEAGARRAAKVYHFMTELTGFL